MIGPPAAAAAAAAALVLGVRGVAGFIEASGKYDPGLKDWRGPPSLRREEIVETASIHPTNLVYVRNEDIEPKSAMLPTYDDEHPAPERVDEIKSYWSLGTYAPRRVALLVEDMEEEYRPYADYILPHCEAVLAAFRKAGLPVIWTNWVRRADDMLYGGLDRFYGPEGTATRENMMYTYAKDGTVTMPELAPQTPSEETLVVKSLHLSKFADLDKDGNEILHPLLAAWEIDTLVVVGSWTDDCIAATATEGVDRYGFDIVIVSDAVASGTTSHAAALQTMRAALATTVTTREIVEFLGDPANSIKVRDGIPLDASARFLAPQRGSLGSSNSGVNVWLVVFLVLLAFFLGAVVIATAIAKDFLTLAAVQKIISPRGYARISQAATTTTDSPPPAAAAAPTLP
ncbi:hypothetical protein CTAYLR_005478 [Chrysophaeum taylorii]|uniref:Isochorismatase-like domain-containing protein n=1 Tax=Chrysophaeum taylorii TaxID=2483200 RepID=A0AAD7U4L5_9STRA|nr:hypothetical protein CTAYLR_005478 [Chrysophaeum taylorii]